MIEVRYGIGTKVKPLRGKRVGVISTTYPGTGEVLVRWLDTFDDERLSITRLRKVG